MNPKTLVIFQGKKIRRTWFNDEWWFVAVDIVEILTNSKDPKGYLKDMRRRDEGFAQGWVQIATPLLIDTPGGKQKLNCISTKGAFRLIQSIPSKKAEPFKKWLAQVGYERVQEIENPELAQNRAKEYYKVKGYPQEWIDKRLRGIAIRQELTEEWDKRSIEKKKEYAILTNEISQATFGVSIKDHKKIKSLDPKLKNQNLRDHLTDLEMIFSMLGEKVTTEITKKDDSQGLKECKVAAKRGGNVAKKARVETEKEIGKRVVSKKNHLSVKKTKELA
ncbi:MAG: Bro-N domain-containing protein [Nanoarchaeota archaeon]|nr:Bro-N domain-containing protein [Nanoarchaeota archaeon]